MSTNGASHSFESALSAGTLARGSYAIESEKPPVVWRWYHLLMVGLCAWGVPWAISLFVDERKVSLTRLIDAALIVQILGYLLAVATIFYLVRGAQKGDWSTLGIQFFEKDFRDLGRGALFGLLLLGIWLPIGFATSQLLGVPMFDALIRALVGDTSQGGLILAAVVVVVGAPIIEEIFFRGILYVKLARLNIWLAIVVTSLLFVLAHGALLIPPLLLMAFGLALKRRRENLWYTIGAHATWNMVVIFLAVFFLLGPSKLFAPADDSYSLRHSADWQRVERAERTFYQVAIVDLALQGPANSAVVVSRFQIPALPRDQIMVELLNGMQQSPSPDLKIEMGQPVRSPTYIEGADVVYEATARVTSSELTGDSRLVGMVAKGSDQAIVLNLICPDSACGKANEDFDRIIRSVHLNV